MTVNQPMGRLEALEYREAAFYAGNGQVGSIDVLRVHFRAPDGDYYHHDLPNGQWALGNDALQFMAKWGYQPTALDGTYHDTHDDQVLVPIAVAPEEMEQVWALGQQAMQGGQQALEDAEWFSEDVGPDGEENRSHGPPGGGGPDPGTGNRTAVDDEEQGGVSAEMAGEDSDQGVEVTVS
jgi:hypothetical protein